MDCQCCLVDKGFCQRISQHLQLCYTTGEVLHVQEPCSEPQRNGRFPPEKDWKRERRPALIVHIGAPLRLLHFILGSRPLGEECLQPSDECLAERSANVQVFRANRAHEPRLRPRRQPRVDLRAEYLILSELPLLLGDPLDVALGKGPNRIVAGNHLCNEVFQFAG